MKDYCLEVCVDSVESAVLAVKGGADRLELCSNLVIGGTTPGVSLFRQVRKACDVPIHVLLRPRYGDFLYTDREFFMLTEDEKMFMEMGADGIVAGCLKKDGSLDGERMEILKNTAGKGCLTLHRAFDLCRDPVQALEDAVSSGVDMILTSGQEETCLKGKKRIGELVRQALGRLEILAGGGVDEEAVLCLLREAGVRQFHMSGKRILESKMLYRRQGVHMGIPGIGEYQLFRADEEKIRRAAKVLSCQALGGGFLSETLKDEARSRFNQVLPFLGMRREEVLHGLSRCTKDEQILMKFLYGTMPLQDGGEYGFDLFLGFVSHALMLRDTMEWCRDIPEELFLHHVLYPRINSEKLEDCRRFFYDRLAGLVKGLSAREAVIAINYWCGEHVVYESTDRRTASPMALFRSGRGRCGEESVFAVTAFRSVGIPARQVYTPRWAHCDDNHAWVEVYVDGGWHFLGACEPEEELDLGWFMHASARALLIHTGIFGGTGKTFGELAGKDGRMVYYNVTSGYARTKFYEIQVVDESLNPVSGASVWIEILNMAEYCPVALLETDGNGKAGLTVGLGDIHVSARKGRYRCEMLCSVKDTDRTVMVLKQLLPDGLDEVWEDSDVEAPADTPDCRPVLAKGQKEKKREWPNRCAKIRKERGNSDEIRRFLSRDGNPDRKALMEGLTKKDYWDSKADVLESHLEYASPFRREWEERGQLEVYEKWILCPRIYLEEITAYRSWITEYFSREERERFQRNPEEIWNMVTEKVRYQPELDDETICASPCATLRLLWGNPISRKILFVAICRTFGIPARLNPVDLEAEYYRKGNFVPVRSRPLEKDPEEKPGQKGTAVLISQEGTVWRYRQNWTIGRLTEGRYKTLDYEGISFTDNRLSLILTPGYYRLITSGRLPGGNQLASEYRFRLKTGEQKEIPMRLRTGNLEEMLVDYRLEDFPVARKNGEEAVMLSSLLDKKDNIFALLSVGEEPTEHVLNEMLEQKEEINRLAGSGSRELGIVFVLQKEEDMENKTLKKVLGQIPLVRTVVGDFDEMAEPLARRIYVDPGQLPLLMAVEPGLRVVYGCSGYHAGSISLIRDLLQTIKENQEIKK